MLADWVDFKEIKQRAGIERVLSRYGIKLRHVGPVDLRGKCPLPTHSSRNSTSSFSVNLSRNAWSCQSASCVAARSGRVGGNVLDLVALMEQCSTRKAALRLQEWFGSQSPGVQLDLRNAEPEPPQTNNRALAFTLHNIDSAHVYLQQREITPETAKSFGIGMYRGNGILHGRIVIPIHDERGQLVAYAGRAIGNEQPKYRFPAGFKKSEVLFNLDRAVRTNETAVIVVEGFFDALRVHQAGYPTVVALMGSSLSGRQADLLTKHFGHALLMLDGDMAGRHGTATITQQLQSVLPVAILEVADGVQPDQLASGEISSIVGRHPYEVDN